MNFLVLISGFCYELSSPTPDRPHKTRVVDSHALSTSSVPCGLSSRFYEQLGFKRETRYHPAASGEECAQQDEADLIYLENSRETDPEERVMSAD